jgi:hypothetical protein
MSLEMPEIKSEGKSTPIRVVFDVFRLRELFIGTIHITLQA